MKRVKRASERLSACQALPADNAHTSVHTPAHLFYQTHYATLVVPSNRVCFSRMSDHLGEIESSAAQGFLDAGGGDYEGKTTFVAGQAEEDKRDKEAQGKDSRRAAGATGDEGRAEYGDDDVEAKYGDDEEDFYSDDEGLNDEDGDDLAAQARAESARIMSKRYRERTAMKEKFLKKRKKADAKSRKSKEKMRAKWAKKLASSPFCVDLVAENERIDEETRIRLKLEEKRRKRLEKRKEKVKKQIILKALAEASDLDSLRREKRLINAEEKRLKALRDLEKTNGKRKQDLLAAQRAERQRKQAQSKFLREQRRKMMRLKVRVPQICRSQSEREGRRGGRTEGGREMRKPTHSLPCLDLDPHLAHLSTG